MSDEAQSYLEACKEVQALIDQRDRITAQLERAIGRRDSLSRSIRSRIMSGTPPTPSQAGE